MIRKHHRYPSLTRHELSRWDHPWAPTFSDEPASEAHRKVVKAYIAGQGNRRPVSLRKITALAREQMDQAGLAAAISSTVTPVNIAPVPGEWVVAPGADPDKRMLYIHGGAFRMGSPRSHRPITSKMSEILGGAVFAVDYRLMPEHPRLACLSDVRKAYKWLVNNGPDGSSVADKLYIAGDSAGGNLTLALLPWIRFRKLQKPTAVVALSPAVDSTASSPSIQRNLRSDIMLRPMFTLTQRMPDPVMMALTAIQSRTLPQDPRISPIFSRLHDLPPTLVQASTAECLEDDSRRWVNKARAAGSPVKIQLWANMLHVWHAFIAQGVPEAEDAFDQIKLFFDEVS